MSNFYTAGAAAMTSNKDDWETPQKLFDQLNEEFHFTLDAASSDQNAKCEHHYLPQTAASNIRGRGRPFSAILLTGGTSATGFARPHGRPASRTRS